MRKLSKEGDLIIAPKLRLQMLLGFQRDIPVTLHSQPVRVESAATTTITAERTGEAMRFPSLF